MAPTSSRFIVVRLPMSGTSLAVALDIATQGRAAARVAPRGAALRGGASSGAVVVRDDSISPRLGKRATDARLEVDFCTCN